jgi:hypothetical protein
MSRIIEKAIEDDQIDILEDGFEYWFPAIGLGAYSAHNLRELADELDRRNAAWEKQIKDDPHWESILKLGAEEDL